MNWTQIEKTANSSGSPVKYKGKVAGMKTFTDKERR
jgi:hypothetical protein